MGNLYVNVTLCGPRREAVLAALADRPSFVSPREHGCTVVFDAACETFDPEEIAGFARRLSRDLGCPALAAMNFDDCFLWLQLYRDGELVDDYDSAPSCFEVDGPAPPRGGDPRALCEAFGSLQVARTERALRASNTGPEGLQFASDRHDELAGALGLPEFAVGYSFSRLAAGERPERAHEFDFLRVA